jgi:hypothetical protein
MDVLYLGGLMWGRSMRPMRAICGSPAGAAVGIYKEKLTVHPSSSIYRDCGMEWGCLDVIIVPHFLFLLFLSGCLNCWVDRMD